MICDLFRVWPLLKRSFQYDQVQDAATSQRIESIYFNFPLSVKFKSDSYKDMKVYVLGGTTYSFDLASNAKARNAEDIVKIGTHDVSLDYGFGLSSTSLLHFAPEIKICNGLNNVHVRDPLLIYSSSLDKLYARTILFTIHLEG